MYHNVHFCEIILVHLLQQLKHIDIDDLKRGTRGGILSEDKGFWVLKEDPYLSNKDPEALSHTVVCDASWEVGRC